MNIFKSWYNAVWSDSSFLDRLLGVTITIVIGVLCVTIIWGFGTLGFRFIDKSDKTIYHAHGVVIGGKFEPEYSTTSLLSTGKVTVPMVTRHSDAYYLNVHIEGWDLNNICVSKDFYDNANIKDSVEIEYSKGKLSSNIYVKTISMLP